MKHTFDRYFAVWLVATGCVIEGPGASWMVLFRRDTTRSASPVEFIVAGPAPTRVLVADLVPGRWQARSAGSAETHRLDVAEDSGAVWFEATAGTWTLRQP